METEKSYRLKSGKPLTLRSGQVVAPGQTFTCVASDIPAAFLDLVTEVPNEKPEKKEVQHKQDEILVNKPLIRRRRKENIETPSETVRKGEISEEQEKVNKSITEEKQPVKTQENEVLGMYKMMPFTNSWYKIKCPDGTFYKNGKNFRKHPAQALVDELNGKTK